MSTLAMTDSADHRWAGVPRAKRAERRRACSPKLKGPGRWTPPGRRKQSEVRRTSQAVRRALGRAARHRRRVSEASEPRSAASPGGSSDRGLSRTPEVMTCRSHDGLESPDALGSRGSLRASALTAFAPAVLVPGDVPARLVPFGRSAARAATPVARLTAFGSPSPGFAERVAPFSPARRWFDAPAIAKVDTIVAGGGAR